MVFESLASETMQPTIAPAGGGTRDEKQLKDIRNFLSFLRHREDPSIVWNAALEPQL